MDASPSSSVSQRLQKCKLNATSYESTPLRNLGDRICLGGYGRPRWHAVPPLLPALVRIQTVYTHESCSTRSGVTTSLTLPARTRSEKGDLLRAPDINITPLPNFLFMSPSFFPSTSYKLENFFVYIKREIFHFPAAERTKNMHTIKRIVCNFLSSKKKNFLETFNHTSRTRITLQRYNLISRE